MTLDVATAIFIDEYNSYYLLYGNTNPSPYFSDFSFSSNTYTMIMSLREEESCKSFTHEMDSSVFMDNLFFTHDFGNTLSGLVQASIVVVDQSATLNHLPNLLMN